MVLFFVMVFVCKYEKYSGLSSRNLTKSIQMQFLVSIKLVCLVCKERWIFATILKAVWSLFSLEKPNKFFEWNFESKWSLNKSFVGWNFIQVGISWVFLGLIFIFYDRLMKGLKRCCAVGCSSYKNLVVLKWTSRIC